MLTLSNRQISVYGHAISAYSTYFPKIIYNFQISEHYVITTKRRNA